MNTAKLKLQFTHVIREKLRSIAQQPQDPKYAQRIGTIMSSKQRVWFQKTLGKVKAAFQRCFYEKMFWKYAANSQEKKSHFGMDVLL